MFKREQKYLVLKLDDIDKYLISDEKILLSNICTKIRLGRWSDGKKFNKYVVVNQDEPYAEEVWKLIEKEENKKAEIQKEIK